MQLLLYSAFVRMAHRGSGASAADLQRKKAKKNPLHKDSKSHKHSSGETRENGTEAHKNKDSCKKRRSSGKHTEQPHSEKVGSCACCFVQYKDLVCHL